MICCSHLILIYAFHLFHPSPLREDRRIHLDPTLRCQWLAREFSKKSMVDIQITYIHICKHEWAVAQVSHCEPLVPGLSSCTYCGQNVAKNPKWMTRYLTCWILPELLPERSKQKNNTHSSLGCHHYWTYMAKQKNKENNQLHPCLINIASFLEVVLTCVNR